LITLSSYRANAEELCMHSLKFLILMILFVSLVANS